MGKEDYEEGYLQNKMRKCLEKIDDLEQRVKIFELKAQRHEQYSSIELNERINKISKQLKDINIENIKKINKEMADKEVKRNVQKLVKLNSELGDQLSDLVIGIFKEQREDIIYNTAGIRVLLSLFVERDLLKVNEREFNEMVEICKNTKETRGRVSKTTIRKTDIDPEEFIKVVKENQKMETMKKMDKTKLPSSPVEGYTPEEFDAAVRRIREFLKVQLDMQYSKSEIDILKEPMWSVYVCPHCQTAKVGLPHMSHLHVVPSGKDRHSVPYQELYKNLAWKDARDHSNVETDVLGIGLPIIDGIDNGPDPQGLVRAFIKILDDMAEIE